MEQVKAEQLYDTYREYMLRIALQVLRNEQDAEDALHNAFLSVVRNLDKITELDSPRTRGYLAVITERKAIDIYHDRKKHESVELAEAEIGVRPPERGGHDLASCISRLQPRYREAILLKYVYGFTVREIADMLEITHAAASKLDQRAKQRLREMCREEGLL